ncbi:cytochrome c oxidase subunit II [Cognatilysobacter lacus]|nr:cytochrome c oxidase subunit II [Lysobacter lacus]
MRRRPGPVALLMLACAGCARESTPMDYMHGAAGPAQMPIQALAQGFTAICTAVVAIIAVLLIVSVRRGIREQRNDGDAVTPGRNGMPWIYWGVGLSVPVLLAMTVWSLLATRAVATPPAAPAVDVEVIGHQWWWELRYHGDRASDIVTTANELVVPVGQPVRLRMTSADVIHDFWVPKLGPKMDLVPGQWNNSWFQADRAGVYVGQCAEYCGVEHGKMGIRVRALPKAQFDTWLALERQPALPSINRGAQVFGQACAACHTVRGTGAGGIVGPDLTHVAGRLTLAAGMLPNTPTARMTWVAHTQQVKPGAQMPEVPLADVDRAAVVDYLGTLR